MAASIITAKVTRVAAASDVGVASTAFSSNDAFVLRVFQALVTAGSGSVRLSIDDSDDGSNYYPIGVFTIPLTLEGLPSDGQCFTVHGTTVAGFQIGTASDKIRSTVQQIVGTGATVTYQLERESIA